MQTVNVSFTRAAEQLIPRMLAEPNPPPQIAVSRMWVSTYYWPYVLGKGKQMADVIKQCLGGTLEDVDAFCDAYTDDVDNNAYLAPRGQAGTGPWICAMYAQTPPS